MRLHFYSWKNENSSSESTKHPPFVFLHGMGGTGALWRPIAAGLEDWSPIFAFDQRGHGKSMVDEAGNPPTSYGPIDYGNDVLETLDFLKLNRVILIGHSMGVRTACAAAHLAPSRIAGLILVDLGLQGLAGGGLGNHLEKLLKNLPDSFPTREAAKNYLQKESPDPAIAQYLVAVSQQRKEDGKIIFPFNKDALLSTLSAVKEFSIRPWILEAANHSIPILLLRGTLSHVWTADQFQNEKKDLEPFPNVELREFEGAGHGLPFEQRAKFIQTVRDFAQKSVAG